MRLGFFIGFLIGAAVASVMSKSERVDTPERDGLNTTVVEEEDAGAGGVLGSLRRRAREAVQAAREASDEKEAEMLRNFEETTGRR